MKNCNDLQQEILSRGLCCFCGTCAGICPAGKIYAKGGKILFNQEKCTNCGLCVQACPGASFNFPFFNGALFPGKGYSGSIYTGRYKEILKGYATDQDVRAKASSGGVVTAVALYLLRAGEIDGVVAVVPSPGRPGAFEPRVLKTEDEVRQSAQSKYTCVPVNTVIRELLGHDGAYLFIGLPCQVQGLRKAMEISPKLASRVYMCIAIFCGFNMEQGATDYLVKKSKFRPGEIESIQYRGKKDGETGFLAMAEGKEFFISKHGYTLLNAFFSPPRCWKCFDLTGEFSDLSCGDAWEMGGGWTRVITRTTVAERVIRGMASKKLLQLSASSEGEMLASQEKIFSYKKRGISVRKKMFPPFPEYEVTYLELPLGEKLKAYFFGLCLKIGRTPLARAFLDVIPPRALECLSSSLRKGNGGHLPEIIRYLFWGITTVLTSLASFAIFRRIGLGYKAANLLSIIITKLEAFFSNKTFVFRSHNEDAGGAVAEAFRFICARGFTGLVEYVGLIFWVDALSMPEFPGKVTLLFITTALNYILGKKFVFTNKGKGNRL